ncbi:MAG TPA: hypothetical protein VGI39_01525 [Polyangiaceae bacterium]|jgi:hypothetical protein
MTPEMMTAIAKIAEETSFKPADVQALAEASAEDLELLLRTYRDANVIASVSVFDRLVAGLKIASEVAGIAIPIVGLSGQLRTLFA